MSVTPTGTINVFGWRRIYDPAEAAYPVRALKLPSADRETSKMYRPPRVLDQVIHPAPAYAWQHWRETIAGTVVGFDPLMMESTLYAPARRLRAAGQIQSYFWTRHVDDIRRALYAIGPVIVGTPWQAQMSTPPHSGIVACEGKILGYHAWVAIGYDPKRGAFRGLNSWSPSWSQVGRFWIREKDLQRLLRGGVACVPVPV